MVPKIRLETTALEELEIDEQKAAESGSVAFELFKEKQETEAVKEAKKQGMLEGALDISSSSSDNSDSGDDSGSDSGDDFSFGGDDPLETSSEEETTSEETSEEESDDSNETTEKDTANADAAETEEQKDDKVRTERLRTLSHIPVIQQELRQEFVGMFAGEAMAFAGETAKFVFGAFSSAGIYLGSKLLNGFYKGTVFLFAQTFQLLGDLYETVELRLERMAGESDRLRKQVKLIRDGLEARLATGKPLDYDAEQTIDGNFDYLHGEHEEFSANLQALNKVLNKEVHQLQEQLLGEFSALEFIAKTRYLQREVSSLSLMKVHPEKMGFTLVEKGTEDSLVDLYALDTKIAQTSLQAYLPKAELDTWENYEKAYKASKVYLTVADNVKAQSVNPKILSVKELGSFLNSVEFLIESIDRHEKLYKAILGKQVGIVGQVKALFMKLAGEGTKSSIRNSAALPLQLKSQFVAKVYTVGAMDVQDHVRRVIANGLSFASAVLKAYR
jgi:hypothetical protein